LAEACLLILREVMERGGVLDHVVARAFRENRRWGKRDRHFIADTVWEVVRWRRRLAFLAGSEEIERLMGVVWLLRGDEPVPLSPEERDEVLRRQERIGAEPRMIRESVPKWLDARGLDECGQGWEPQLAALNRRAPVFLRVNRLRADRDSVARFLSHEGVEVRIVEGLPDALRLAEPLPRRLAADSRFEIQDGGSQMIAPFLGVRQGMKVLDACAGSGGKTLHLAALMENQGELLAMDVSARKLEILKSRAARAGVKNLRVARWDAEALRQWRGWADRLLIDAPCSGLGTLRRQPDLKWRIDSARLAKVCRTQRKLLDHYPELLGEGGEFVYATCSVLPSENRRQIDALCERDPRWRCLEDRTIDPSRSDFDGFYMARCGR
jgi:16S rRNA (cytosine967-C5)-methyltransferase